MRNDHAQRVHERLSVSPALRPVGSAEDRRFACWDLSALAEGALGECLDPDSLTAARERESRLRLGPYGQPYRHDDDYRRRYWIEDAARRAVGTIAVDTWPTGTGALPVWSLYVHPVARRRGLASAALDTVYGACRAEGLHGFRLDAYWTWQKSVRYYLARGLWVTSWKHALGFARLSYLPPYEVRENGEELTFLVAGRAGAGDAGGMVPLLVAGGERGLLRLREAEEYGRAAARMPDERDAVRLRLYARSTLAAHLAVRGRPLLRGEEEWAEARQGHWCDIGEPEGLARRIEGWERVAREGGWRVESPYGGAAGPQGLAVGLGTP